MIVSLRKRTLSFMITGLFCMGLSLGLYNLALHPNMGKWVKEGLVITKIQTEQKVAALTFDDGPDPKNTPEVLRVLKKHNTHATFFVLGRRAENQLPLIKKMAAEGHEIGNHSYTHADFNRINNQQIIEEIRKTANIIYKGTGQKPLLFRPPGGYLSNDLIKISQNEKVTIAYWSYQTDSKDWKDGTSASSIANHIIRNLAPGQIIILHDGASNGLATAKAVDLLLSRMIKEGYRFVPMGELINLENKE